ncbi:hypothetical protein DFJ58DRAFT_120881 [Suillus subalutaceus]|uniref:uncharacterized protein n=1 Tax=Suillus subalutaceus TaxID=48586 RepID=UPI001B87482E|nr:uncharacterized protein DFJ58DRAFT_120881 [Suillus subalutaceus]KAG1838913.1 hypothetical protein DFJ58DRAFT_120881 [Suillus subalutaceus]
MCRAPTIYFHHFSLPTFLCPPAQNMASASPRSSPAPADTDLPTNENSIDTNAVTEEPIEVDLHKNKSSTPEQIRDQVKLKNASEEHVVSIDGGLGRLARNMSNNPEQTADNGLEPNNTNENPAVSVEGRLTEMSDTLGQILEVLKGSKIAEELGKDDNSKFWATYKKFSTEYDNDFLRRANDDMGIVLTFAGLLSTVIAAFIVGMQPNPGDTTNSLLLYLIQINVNGPNSVPDISNLSSSTEFPPSTVWIQMLAYVSLVLSLLAAFGATLCKQWLNSYTREVRGTLEERGIYRQIKLDGLENFRMQSVVQALLVLLQASVMLFALSLSANMWAKQIEISTGIICTTAFGLLFYVSTILVSVLRPDSPFPTPASELMKAICQHYLPRNFNLIPPISRKSSAIRWILETLTDPEFVDAAAAMVPRVQWPATFDTSAAFKSLRNIFVACRDREELYVQYGKAMAHLCIQPVKISKHLLMFFPDVKFSVTRSRFIYDAFMAGRAAYEQLKNPQEEDAQCKHRASARTALRTMLVYGLDNQLSRPDDEELIWKGDLCWYHGDKHEPRCEEFDWLIDYLADSTKHGIDDETEGDALLALSGMRGLGSSTKQASYISSLIHSLESTRPPRVRYTALRAVFEAREKLASMASPSMSEVDAQLLDQLSLQVASLITVPQNNNPAIEDNGPDASSHNARDSCYLRLIYALTKNNEWHERLTRDGHLNRCVDGVSPESYSQVGFYPLVIFGRIKSSGKDLQVSPADERWRLLIARTWDALQRAVKDDTDIDEIPTIVTATRLNWPASDDGVQREWFADLAAKVHGTLVKIAGETGEACE